MLVAMVLNQNVESTAILNDTPQPVLLVISANGGLIEVLFVAELRRPERDCRGEIAPESVGLAPHGFVADDNATGSQQMLDHSQA
jgi:hypothetical protein